MSESNQSTQHLFFILILSIMIGAKACTKRF